MIRRNDESRRFYKNTYEKENEFDDLCECDRAMKRKLEARITRLENLLGDSRSIKNESVPKGLNSVGDLLSQWWRDSTGADVKEVPNSDDVFRELKSLGFVGITVSDKVNVGYSEADVKNALKKCWNDSIVEWNDSQRRGKPMSEVTKFFPPNKVNGVCALTICPVFKDTDLTLKFTWPMYRY